MEKTRRRKFPLAGLPKEQVELHRKLARALRVADSSDLFGEDPPAELMSDYDIDWDNAVVVQRLQRKYLDRSTNIRRCWNRLQLYLPELLTPGHERVLEMSTAHGGMLEILRHFGHDVLGNDYVNMVSGDASPETNARFRTLNDKKFKRDTDDHGVSIADGASWPYQEIIESIGIPMALFDAGRTPYPFDDKAFDTVICCQAIEHYCHPGDWGRVVEEFCRISRKSVFVLLNPMLPNLAEDPSYADAFEQFRRDLRSYNKHGFRCTSCHVHWGRALGFKLMAG